ncbi:hypothetical protein [Streptosporangium saharense]|uniref:Uncharacterized protein n=1 Tax=Streptosporangium saharense TaxID=1706840 RepID=A0A7W7QQS9_9ACTN|nr:hypothetical protein [Streptosporangium saharense]MBB4917396.1 hypothetical protein [Streptosporangium saharense]
MNDRTEADLVRMLADAAERAPVPDGDLAGAVRVRRRAHRTRMALACAAVVAIAVGGTVAVRDALPTASEPVSPAAQGPSEEPAEFAVRPASEVWPEAVTTIPKKAADGLTYRPVAALGPTTLLLIAESSFEKAARLDTYDTTTGRGTPLVQVPSPEGKRRYYAQAVEVGDDTVAWWGNVQGKSTWADFWVAPRSGGTARQVGEVTGALADVERIGVTRDSLMWSVRGGGVYRIPLEGGTPQPVPGGEGLSLVSWPWASDASEDRSRNQTKLVNLATGQTIPVNLPEGADGVRCSLVWCAGTLGEGSVVQRVDGGDRRTLPGTSSWEMTSLSGARTGFVGMTQGDRYAAVIYDPETGLAGGIGGLAKDRGSWFGVGVSSSPPSLVYTDPPSGEACKGKPAKCQKEYLVINLLALPAS